MTKTREKREREREIRGRVRGVRGWVRFSFRVRVFALFLRKESLREIARLTK
jgi:hypothetical protein